MLNKDDDYRREAADAERLAEKAKNERDRAAWHRIAELWLDLIERGANLRAGRSDDSGRSAHT